MKQNGVVVVVCVTGVGSLVDHHLYITQDIDDIDDEPPPPPPLESGIIFLLNLWAVQLFSRILGIDAA